MPSPPSKQRQRKYTACAGCIPSDTLENPRLKRRIYKPCLMPISLPSRAIKQRRRKCTALATNIVPPFLEALCGKGKYLGLVNRRVNHYTVRIGVSSSAHGGKTPLQGLYETFRFCTRGEGNFTIAPHVRQGPDGSTRACMTLAYANMNNNLTQFTILSEECK